jgi:hypothetical protein
MKVKITKRAIDTMKPGDLLADDEVRGFVDLNIAIPPTTLQSGTRSNRVR